MRLQHWLKTIAFIACLLALTGCEQYYTGALGIGGDQTAVQKDHHQHHRQIASPQPQSPNDPAVDPPGGARTLASAAGDPSPSAARAADHLGRALRRTPPSKQHNLSANNLARMNLFGQLQGKSHHREKFVTENLQRITFSTIGADFDPAISPDGSKIVYASTSYSKKADIFVKRVGSTAITQLTNDPSNDVMPAWSPHGKRIAFCSDRSGNWNIYMMSDAGGQAVQITDDPTDDLHPSFSPDGSKLVYCSYGSATNQWELVVIDLSNPGTKHIIGRGLFPSWAPNGKAILFQRARQRGTRWFSVWAVNYANGQASSPTELASSPNAAVITPAWSPNGQHIVFCTVIDPAADDCKGPEAADIWVMNADGSGRSCLTSGQFMNLEPTWSRDGTIYFVSNRAKNGIENIWSLRPDQALGLANTHAQPKAARTN